MCRVIRFLGRLSRYGVPLLGLGLIVAAFTASLTGADPEGNWGPARRQALAAGTAILAASVVVSVWPAIDRQLISLWASAASRAREAAASVRRRRFILASEDAIGRLSQPLGRAVRPLRPVSAAMGNLVATRERRVIALAVLVFLLAVPVYIWIGSAGFWSGWPRTTSYYNDLAQAFRTGQLHLQETPDEELLALEDPYDPHQRGQIPFLWDVVLFGGRFYLYWGPVPALLVAGWTSLFSGQVGDNALVFIFTLGALLFTLLLLGEIFISLFPTLRARIALVPFLVAAFAYPLPWLMSGPSIYEASIASGQAFLMGALYFAARVVLGRGRVGPNLPVAGLFLSFAAGSKASLAPATVFWAAAGALAVIRLHRLNGPQRSAGALSFLLPFLLGMTCLGWYNAARFGSPFEFGFRYQLTGMDLNRDYRQAFTVMNVPINLYTYLFTPVQPIDVFPWIRPVLGHTSPPPLSWAALHIPGASALTPSLYYSEQVTGIVIAFPFAAFSLVGPLIWLRSLCPPADPGRPSRTSFGADPHSLRVARLGLALACGAILAFSLTLAFAFATARYAADVVPTLMVLSALGLWSLHKARRDEAQSTWWVSVLAWLVGVASIVMSLLLAFTGYHMRFERLNFDLYNRILNLLPW